MVEKRRNFESVVSKTKNRQEKVKEKAKGKREKRKNKSFHCGRGMICMLVPGRTCYMWEGMGRYDGAYSVV